MLAAVGLIVAEVPVKVSMWTAGSGSGPWSVGAATLRVYAEGGMPMLVLAPASQAIALTVTVPVLGFVTVPLTATCAAASYVFALPVQVPFAALHVGSDPSSV